MNIAGLTAEFNPLHNGHRWLLQQARERHDIDAVVCALSGAFLQRGEAAICSKWARAHMAVLAGCDLVIELPFCCAVRSAGHFARGAVLLLKRTGICTHLLFAAEDPQEEWLRPVASLLAEESPAFKRRLEQELAAGQSFAAARARALQAVAPDLPGLGEKLARPNNILALEYLRARLAFAPSLKPIIIPRRGEAYHSDADGFWASAAAIRQWLTPREIRPADPRPRRAMPDFAHQILHAEIAAGRAPISTPKLSLPLLNQLRNATAEELGTIYEINEGLEYRIKQAARQAGSYENLRHAIKSKRFSLSRINRILLYALLQVQTDAVERWDSAGPQYLHVLAFSPRGQALMKSIKHRSALPLLTRGSAVKAYSEKAGAPVAQAMLKLDIKATDLYSLLHPNAAERFAGRDFTTSALAVPTPR